MAIGPKTEAMKATLQAKPGAEAHLNVPPVAMYKIHGKMFAILSLKGDAFVILKCDPHLVEILREQYEGVGRRGHLDPRNWICVLLDADVPEAEIERLVDHSYDLVKSGLTKKQRAALEGLHISDHHGRACPGDP